ncbi:MAG: hypothetical protein MHPSP_002975, partial [Paramarteilia canceri]
KLLGQKEIDIEEIKDNIASLSQKHKAIVAYLAGSISNRNEKLETIFESMKTLLSNITQAESSCAKLELKLKTTSMDPLINNFTTVYLNERQKKLKEIQKILEIGIQMQKNFRELGNSLKVAYF